MDELRTIDRWIPPETPDSQAIREYRLKAAKAAEHYRRKADEYKRFSVRRLQSVVSSHKQ